MRNFGRAFGIPALLAAWLVMTASWTLARTEGGDRQPADEDHPAGEKKEGQEPGHKAGAHGGHHEPTASDEMGDKRGSHEHDRWWVFETKGIHLPLVGWFTIFGYSVPTKYMWLILIAALLVAVIYIGLARRVRHGEPASGPFWNLFESFLTFVRDEVAKPNFPEHHDHGHGHGDEHGHAPDHAHAADSPGHAPAPFGEHPADRFVPFLWTLFLFILFMNLLGMIPFLGSPTANIYVTLALAVCCFLVIHGAAIAKMGFIPYVKALWPKIDVGIPGLGLVIKLMIFVIELISSVIKSGVLALRLFANMFAGHMVLASILLFIVAARASQLWAVVTGASVIGVVALSLLELFVAFLQAYIFVFLAALFMGMALNPEH